MKQKYKKLTFIKTNKEPTLKYYSCVTNMLHFTKSAMKIKHL